MKTILAITLIFSGVWSTNIVTPKSKIEDVITAGPEFPDSNNYSCLLELKNEHFQIKQFLNHRHIEEIDKQINRKNTSTYLLRFPSTMIKNYEYDLYILDEYNFCYHYRYEISLKNGKMGLKAKKKVRPNEIEALVQKFKSKEYNPCRSGKTDNGACWYIQMVLEGENYMTKYNRIILE
jgi:hypothetical protein